VLEDTDSRVFVCFFESAFMGPVDVSAGILALHPVSELLVRARKVLLELRLVRRPVGLKLLLCFQHVPIDRLCFDLADGLPLNKVSFFIPCSPSHGASEPGATHMLLRDSQSS